MNERQMTKAALAAWPDVLCASGRSAEGISAEVFHVKTAARERHVMLRLQGAGLIYKQGFGPHADLVLTAAQAVQDAGVRLKGSPEFQTPDIPYIDAARHAIVMRDVAAPHAEDWLLDRDLSQAARLELLSRLGGWIAAHAAAQDPQVVPMRKGFILGKLGELATKPAPAADDLHHYAFKASRLIQQRPSVQMARRQPHGDLILHNMLIAPDTTVAIDLRARAAAPIGLDIANILVDYASLYGTDQPKVGSVLSASEHAAFFAHLDDQDPSILPHILLKALTRWGRIDPSAITRSPRQSRRLTGLQRIAAHLLG